MTVEQVEEETSRRVLALVALWLAGRLSAPDLSTAVSTVVFAGKVVATRLADITISVAANAPPIGLSPGTEHLQRLAEAVTTVVEDESLEEVQKDPRERLTRLSEAEVLLSHRKSLHAALRAQGFRQWVRVVAVDGCEVCRPFHGMVYEISDAFTDHPGCRCTLEPHGNPDLAWRRAQEAQREQEARQARAREARRSSVLVSSDSRFAISRGVR